MDQVPFLIPLLIAFSSGLHCLGMCGGIIGAMAFSLPVQARQRPWGVFGYLLAANLGRLTSYGLAGWLASRFGHALLTTLSPASGHLWLQIFAALLLVATGLLISGHVPALGWLERLGEPLWRRLEPLGRRWISPHTHGQAFLFGAVWGWLPCSMVYSALLWSASACAPLNSALLMVLFGVGTLPFTLPVGWLAHGINKLAIFPWIRQTVAVALVTAGVFSLYGANQEEGHHDHLLHSFHAITLCQEKW